MSLFKKIKNWFNGGDDKDDILVLKTPLTTKKDAKVDTVVKTEPLTVKPKKRTAKKPNLETKDTLAKLTKVQIDELALERYGAHLDRRKRKEDMIESYLILQKEVQL
jgi:hypothetical protein